MTDSQKLDMLLIKMDNMGEEIQELRSTMGEEVQELRSTMGGEIQELRSTVGGEIQELRKENKEIKEKIHKIEDDVKETKEKVGKVEVDVKEMKEKVGKIELDMKGMKLILENEIRMNIRRVAEGHLDLSRHIRNIMDAKEEMEGLTVRVNMLETEVREQNRKIS